MKLITRSDIEQRLLFEEQNLNNTDESDVYYSNAIDQFQKNGKDIWNWAAALSQCKWLIYRGMFFYAFLYILLIAIPEAICLEFIYQASEAHNYENLVLFIGFVWIFFDPISFLILGKFGNRLYFRFLDKKINKDWNLVPKNNTHGWLVCALYFFNLLLLYIFPYYLYRKVIFNRDLKKKKEKF